MRGIWREILSADNNEIWLNWKLLCKTLRNLYAFFSPYIAAHLTNCSINLKEYNLLHLSIRMACLGIYAETFQNVRDSQWNYFIQISCQFVDKKGLSYICLETSQSLGKIVHSPNSWWVVAKNQWSQRGYCTHTKQRDCFCLLEDCHSCLATW